MMDCRYAGNEYSLRPAGAALDDTRWISHATCRPLQPIFAQLNCDSILIHLTTIAAAHNDDVN